MTPPIILTLTSIPPRFAYLPEHFAKLSRQSMRPLKVELNLPRRYRRFPGELPSLPPLPDWVTVHWVERDLGPATKILPSCERHRGLPVRLLYCDDDQTYGHGLIESFATRTRDVDAEILCGMGFDVSQRYGLGSAPKRQPRARPFCFTLRDGVTHVVNDVLSWLKGDRDEREWRQTSYPGQVDIFEGFRGVLVSPDTFPKAAWDIPERFLVADDVWLSGHAAAAGARAWMLDMPMNRQRLERQGRIAALHSLVHQGMDREQLYRACIRYFQDAHGVWT